MKRGSKLIALLAVLVLLVGLTALVKNRNQASDEEDAVNQFLIELETADVTELSWQYGEEKFTFTRMGSGWSYPADAAFPVSQAAVENLLTTLNSAVVSKTIEDVADLAEYGLAAPTCVITVTSGSTRTVSIGNESAMGGEVYVTLDGQTVYLVSANVLSAFTVELYSFLHEESIPYMSNVTDVLVERKSGDLEIHAETGGSGTVWHAVSGGEELELDTSLVKRFITTVSGIYWSGCVEHNADAAALKAYGLNSPRAVLTVTYTENTQGENGETVSTEKTFTLEIGSDTENGVYVRLPGSAMVYEISDSFSYEILHTMVDDLLPAKEEAES